MDFDSTTRKTTQGSASGEKQSRDGDHGLFRRLRRLCSPVGKKNENGRSKAGQGRNDKQARSAGRIIRSLVSSMKASRPSAAAPQHDGWTVLGVENSGNKPVPTHHMVSTPEIYSRLLLSHRHGYPLYHPEADLGLPSQYRRRGVSIGDVGIVTRDGTFDFLFNVCSSYAAVNPRELPDDFELLQSDYLSCREYLRPKRHLFSDNVKQINDSPVAYECSGPEGAVLELPKGAMLFEATNRCPFQDLAARHALNWYKYMFIDKARDANNGSLYLVTGCVKAKEWGIAVFDRPSSSQDYLRFVADASPHEHDDDASYSWEMMGAVIAKIVPNTDDDDDDVITNDGEEHNQCLFLRGYKIMLREQIWNLLVNRQLDPAQFLAQQETNRTNHEDQSGAPWGSDSEATLKSDPVQGVLLTEHFGVPLLHPSDFINRSLLQCAPGANVALTHDDEWCTTLPDHFASIKLDELRKKVFEEYTHSVDKYGCVSLKAQPNGASTAVVE